MNSDTIVDELVATSALLTGHFQLSSGLHSSRYVQCALLFADPMRAGRVGVALAAKAPKGVEFVVSPAMGGVIIGHEVARALRVTHFFAERVDGKMHLRRGFTLPKGAKVLIVEDVFTTGKSTQETVDLVESLGAKAVAALSVVRRSEGKLAIAVPHDSLLQLNIESWEAKDCPLCKTGTPAVKPGSRPDAKAKAAHG